jgi:hypothetical protein
MIQLIILILSGYDLDCITWDMGGICNVQDESVCCIAAQNFLNSFIFCFTSGVILKRHTRPQDHLLI